MSRLVLRVPKLEARLLARESLVLELVAGATGNTDSVADEGRASAGAAGVASTGAGAAAGGTSASSGGASAAAGGVSAGAESAGGGYSADGAGIAAVVFTGNEGVLTEGTSFSSVFTNRTKPRTLRKGEKNKHYTHMYILFYYYYFLFSYCNT